MNTSATSTPIAVFGLRRSFGHAAMTSGCVVTHARPSNRKVSPDRGSRMSPMVGLTTDATGTQAVVATSPAVTTAATARAARTFPVSVEHALGTRTG